MRKDEHCLEWGRSILKKLNLVGWTIKWESKDYTEGIALLNPKVIHIYWPEGKPSYPLMLHEIAHAVIGTYEGHDSEYAHKYMELVGEYFTPKKM